ncbi:hypothetical protein [Caballeronia sp. BR00000012568055]|uniref:hypothetical protein n=1 Tax=Caballeronia sp. BR00000012568055 TaxID=2918761 RepID=UPI0023F8859F|nr:hypothetical protein [Caballeronia sp. BR00000012568055]
MSLIRFLAIYALNFFRIGFQTVAIAWFATLATGRVSAVAELLLVSSVSTLCISPIIGRLVDSISRKKMLLCLGQVSAFFFGLIATCILRFAPSIAPFFVLSSITVLLSGASLLSSGAMDYFLRTFISDEIRARQLARINTVNQIALIAGT